MPLTEVKLFNHPIYEDYACNIHTGDIYSLKNNQIKLIKQILNNRGYLVLTVYKNGKHKIYQSHRFIYECYENEILDKNIEIDHQDKNKLNNSIDNLRKVSRTTNNLNRFENEEVDKLPDDKIEVINYNFHEFENLWFSPSTNCLYKISEGYIFKIPFKSYKNNYGKNINCKNKIVTQVFDINKNNTHIYLNKLREILGCD